MAALMPQGKQQYFTAGGIPLVGGKVYTYAAGTTTPLATYTTSAASTPNANPVILDSRGEASIFFSAANYKIVVKDSLDSTIWTQDNLAGDSAATVVANLAASTGSSLVGHIASGAGAVATTVQTKLRETTSVFDFMTPTQIANVQAGTTDATLTAAIQAGIDACDAAGRNLYFPSGSYSVDVLTILNTEYNFSMSCDGAKFVGTASTTRNGIFDIRNAVDFDMFGKWRLWVNGNTNYTAAFSLKAQAGGAGLTTRVNVYGLLCYGAKQAIHINDYNNDLQCSEINFFGHDAVVCPIDVYLGGSQTLASFNGCNLVSEPNAAFPGAPERVVWQEGGIISVNGGEFVLAASTTGRGISFCPASSVTYDNPYGIIRINGAHSEVSSQFLHIENERALAAPKSDQSMVLVTGSGGYVTPGIGAEDYLSCVDATYEGHLAVNNSNFYTTSVRTGKNISSTSTLMKVTCDKTSFGDNFLKWMQGVGACQMIHDLQPLANASGIGVTITGATTLKFINSVVTGNLVRYGPQYNTTTGVYRTSYDFDRVVVSATIIGTAVTADLFIKRAGTIVAFGAYDAASGVGKIDATLWTVAAGTDIEVVLQPLTPAAFDSSIFQSLQISGSTDK